MRLDHASEASNVGLSLRVALSHFGQRIGELSVQPRVLPGRAWQKVAPTFLPGPPFSTPVEACSVQGSARNFCLLAFLGLAGEPCIFPPPSGGGNAGLFFFLTL